MMGMNPDSSHPTSFVGMGAIALLSCKFFWGVNLQSLNRLAFPFPIIHYMTKEDTTPLMAMLNKFYVGCGFSF
jgi:hypothetical protein